MTDHGPIMINISNLNKKLIPSDSFYKMITKINTYTLIKTIKGETFGDCLWPK